MESVQEAEYVIAKAIRDGVIDATINHKDQYLQTKQIIDIYSTNEPQSAFFKRTSFCNSLRNEAVKALEYPKKEEKAIKLPGKKEVVVAEDIVDFIKEVFD
jgi:26S proteasome regulatory subunit N3